MRSVVEKIENFVKSSIHHTSSTEYICETHRQRLAKQFISDGHAIGFQKPSFSSTTRRERFRWRGKNAALMMMCATAEHCPSAALKNTRFSVDFFCFLLCHSRSSERALNTRACFFHVCFFFLLSTALLSGSFVDAVEPHGIFSIQ